MKHLILSFFLLSSFSIISQNLEEPLITVQGSAVVFANPDEVLISVSLYKKDMIVAKARDAYEMQSKAVIGMLKNHGINERHIQTHHASIGPKRKRNSTKLDHYYATQTINVCIRDLNKYDQIVKDLVELDVHKIGQANFRCDDIKERREEALKLAVKNAKEKAELMVGSIGQSIGMARTINEIQNRRTSFNAETYGSSTVATGGTSVGSTQGFAPGQLEIKSTVNVSFMLK